MGSTIRISAAGKRALEALRRRWEAAEGRKLTQEEVAGRALAQVAAQADREPDTWKPTAAQRAFMKRFIASCNDPQVQSSDLDDVLYGPRA